MKKLIVITLAVMMFLGLVITANAAVGTVVYATRVETAPNIEKIDESWGEPAIVINSKSPNTELYNYWTTENRYVQSVWDLYISGGYNFAPEDNDVYLYYHWDNKYFYFGLKTRDDAITGWQQPWEGDGVQMWIQPMDGAVNDGAVYAGVNPHDTVNPGAGLYDFFFTLGMDDYTAEAGTAATNAAVDCDYYINTDVEGELQCILRVPLSSFGLNGKNDLTGVELATAVLRVSSVGTLSPHAYAGWLAWGKYFTDTKADSLNTIVFTTTEPADTTPADTTPVDTTPTDSTNPSEADLSGVSSWALTEVEAAINEGLVPEYIQKDWTSPITRGQVSEMFIRLLEKATGKTVDAIIAEKGATIEEGKFEDTNDANVYAANALGIINGTSSTKFSPDGTLKRAQIAALINRVAKVVGVETEGYTHHFEDITDNYSWVDTELGWPSTVGIINGVSSTRFNPGGDLTTEQAILITYRALGALK